MAPDPIIEPEFELIWDETPRRIDLWQCYPVNYIYDTGPVEQADVPVVVESKD
jgi:hypothetical protein